MELYIHIPFCARKCLYCDFLSFSGDEETRERYVDKLAEEIRAWGRRIRESQDIGSSGKDRRITSIFMGGGTPSLLKTKQLVLLIENVYREFQVEKDAEITMEANPGTVDRDKLFSCREAGFNRLSLGMQSTDDGELMALGRIHTFRDFEESFHTAREAGFSNINVDLMSALPGQTFESYKKTLERTAGFLPEHISAYSLILEEGTPFYEKYAAPQAGGRSEGGSSPLPDEDTDRRMYHFTKRYLSEMGWERYEISNYARPGKECVHNTGYWDGTYYLGLGLGAASYLDKARFTNERALRTYLEYSEQDFEKGRHLRESQLLSEKERMEEFMFLGLRLTRGVSEEEFYRRFGVPMAQVYRDVLERCEKDGLTERYTDKARFLRLTEYGMDVSNYVLSRFLMD